jgi:CHAD domain-containing protein
MGAQLRVRDHTRAMLSERLEVRRLGSDRSVHSRRKKMKRIRAALRLLRAALGDSLYRSANAGVRDAARPLTAVRDAAALIQLCRQPAKRKDASLYDRYAQRAIASLREELQSARRNLKPKMLRDGAARLRNISARLESAPPQMNEQESVGRGMKTVFKQGRRAMARAQRDPSVENLHEWRKQAKYLFHQTELLKSLVRVNFKPVRKRSEKLGTLLGNDHDLAMLHRKLEEYFNRGLLPGNGTARGIFNRKLQRRRQKLQKKSFKVGKRLYGQSPANFAGSLRSLLAPGFAAQDP